jgi:hypothetical protein
VFGATRFFAPNGLKEPLKSVLPSNPLDKSGYRSSPVFLLILLDESTNFIPNFEAPARTLNGEISEPLRVNLVPSLRAKASLFVSFCSSFGGAGSVRDAAPGTGPKKFREGK